MDRGKKDAALAVALLVGLQAPSSDIQRPTETARRNPALNSDPSQRGGASATFTASARIVRSSVTIKDGKPTAEQPFKRGRTQVKDADGSTRTIDVAEFE